MMRLRIAAATILTMLAFAVEAHALPAHGGAGGTPFELDCGPRGVLTGLVVRRGQVVDGMVGLCTQVDENGAWTGNGWSTQMAGGMGGSPTILRCDQGWGVSGIVGGSGALVDRIGIRCGQLGKHTWAGGSYVKVLSGDVVRGPAGGGGGTAFDDTCRSGKTVRRLAGRAGTKIDRIQAICHTPTRPGSRDFAHAVAVQPDGKIVVVGDTTAAHGADTDVFVARYLPGGSLDTEFGNHGVQITGVSDGSDWARGVVIAPDGKIVVGIVDIRSPDTNRIGLLRFLPDGRLDLAFGEAGFVLLPQSVGSSFDSMAIAPDGKILLADAYLHGVRLTRVDQTGALDASLGGDGNVQVPYPLPAGVYAHAGDYRIDTLLPQPDGRILVGGGRCWVFQTGACSQNAVLARFMPNGTLDTSFGDGGFRDDPSGATSGERFSNVDLQPDRKILAVWQAAQTRSSIQRFYVNGTVDTSFGENGRTFIVPDNNWSRGQAMAISFVRSRTGRTLPSRILVAGIRQSGFFVSRLMTDGSLDPTFDGDGFAPVALQAGNRDVLGMALGDGGRVAVVGRGSFSATDMDTVLFGLTSTGALDASFGEAGIVQTDCGTVVH